MDQRKRNILVVGATGKQGSATVRHLLAPTSPRDTHVWALTRKISSPSASALVSHATKTEVGDRLHLIEGDLEDAARIRGVFDTIASSEGGLWGVFVALAFPGLGAKDDRERDQGMMLADLALQHNVSAFLYSSALQPSPDPEKKPEYSRLSKKAVEDHCKKLGEKGLNWVILQPGFFMENFDGMIGSITVTFFREGLREDTALVLIASEDIGRVAAGVFANHEKYLHKVLSLTSEALTTRQIMDAYQRATGSLMPTIPRMLARVLRKLNSDAQVVLDDIENNQDARRNGLFPGFEQQVELGQSVCKLQTFEEWARRQKEEGPLASDNPEWNRLSVWKLLTGRV